MDEIQSRLETIAVFERRASEKDIPKKNRVYFPLNEMAELLCQRAERSFLYGSEIFIASSFGVQIELLEGEI